VAAGGDAQQERPRRDVSTDSVRNEPPTGPCTDDATTQAASQRTEDENASDTLAPTSPETRDFSSSHTDDLTRYGPPVSVHPLGVVRLTVVPDASTVMTA
jgi:hypothetical protein